MNVKNKKILVYGLGISGVQIINFLLEKKAKVFVYDDNVKLSIQNTIPFNINFDFKQIDFAIVSPGIFDTYLLKLLSVAKINIMSEIEFASKFVKKGKIIAITGTNGKTTTTQMLGKIFSLAGKDYAICGNIGAPFISFVKNDNKNFYFIVEVSSFQLEHCSSFKPDIALILNISPDHLDRHKTLQIYKELKFSIAANQTKNDYLIINNRLLGEKQLKNIKSKVLSFGGETTFVYEDKIMFEKKQIINTNQISIFGQKNLENLMASLIVANICKIDFQHVKQVAETFQSDHHRIEKIAKIKGITFIDDSKATNVSSTICALEVLFQETIILLLGGSDKGYEFDEIFEHAKNVKHVFCYGQTKTKIYEAAMRNQFDKITICDNMTKATVGAMDMAEKDDYIVLSPACASFDEFKSYEHRAQVFRGLVYGKKKN